MDEKLARFIDHARQKGLDHAMIFMLLRTSGWKGKQLAEALAAGGAVAAGFGPLAFSWEAG